ncbi:MAG: photosynthetic reaction center cytochrome c subunit family protein, partial [Acidobacteriota bacterium]
LPGMMSALTGLLGVDCSHCHAPREWEKETPAKQTARKHFAMQSMLLREYFNNENKITCWTCHRGKPQPEPPPASFRPTDEMRKQADQDKRPVEEVYKNIQSLRGVPAGRWMMIMTMFTRSLGVDCNYCHVEGRFELDDKSAKQTARRMLRMVGTIAREIYKGPTSINCYTCHRGQTRPVSLPPETPAKKQ